MSIFIIREELEKCIKLSLYNPLTVLLSLYLFCVTN